MAKNDVEKYDELRQYSEKVGSDLDEITDKYDAERSLIFRIFLDYIKRLKKNKDGK